MASQSNISLNISLNIDSSEPENESNLEEQSLKIHDESLGVRWKADRPWCMRLMVLIYNEVKIQTLLAWCNTLGGAHSSLGETTLRHAAEAGLISRRQYELSHEKGDHVMMCRCRLYLAFSHLQLKNLKEAKTIIKEEYHNLNTQTSEPDRKLLNMCLSAWNKYKQIKKGSKKLTVSS
ncbi:PREDICTED: uncharacterized protein F58A4.6-like [Amphimedon queenslandica]|uniref:Uncharacterized protein n=1 Tax=Amphimedon queenslandica TaxID=400682 RepID=A0AAN0IWG9_AMPQE|nr:PREDICTED: uncharacterized protein F58A4.6-like [Amphimedon queenslandica]XP_019848777.1 PREDICTED: uncharacterized protein F58A4.6-like [Amphimedon queenslandica]XP_019848778.1 PREDICTED: uncharacterized protein F58A4.6-like [Amphimedon queenslandica]|eukprot:XP_019848776.1 PREDICTED: uncharacterized protein F58A4.6-like [Amphimedon queenslandica]